MSMLFVYMAGGEGGAVRGLKRFCQRGSGSTCFVCVCVWGGGGAGSVPLPSVKKLTDPPPIDK